MQSYSVSDVFNESDVPILTFVKPKEYQDIIGSIHTSGKHITISGPSGCGKTTLARKSLAEAGFGPGNTHWISGRDHAQTCSVAEIFLREFSCSNDESEILEYLKVAGIIIFDDFHHLQASVRDDIGYKLKRWHELGIRFFIIGIASSSKKMLDIDPELGIRNDVYEMKRQDETFCRKVIELGEQHLNIQIAEDSKKEYITASNGIPSAIQVICRVACIRNDVLKTESTIKTISCNMQTIKDGVLRIYNGKYHNKLIGLCKGKQQARSVHIKTVVN